MHISGITKIKNKNALKIGIQALIIECRYPNIKYVSMILNYLLYEV